MASDGDHAFDLASAIRRSRSRRKQRSQRPLVHHRESPGLPAGPNLSPVRSPTQALGDYYESRAASLLTKSGCEILGRQLHCRFGEIDLAVREGSMLVFVEVRSCRTMRYGGAVASVGHSKQKRLILAARWWMSAFTRVHFEGIAPACRFDLIAFESGTPLWIRDAFSLT